mmetsp:Transcript_7288/g.18277  ORF Transcript_7288/g.18277 Transcript_7288/m.18277 type:complete len:220 (-) Transcript_7288:810-1469(-)
MTLSHSSPPRVISGLMTASSRSTSNVPSSTMKKWVALLLPCFAITTPSAKSKTSIASASEENDCSWRSLKKSRDRKDFMINLPSFFASATRYLSKCSGTSEPSRLGSGELGALKSANSSLFRLPIAVGSRPLAWRRLSGDNSPLLMSMLVSTLFFLFSSPGLTKAVGVRPLDFRNAITGKSVSLSVSDSETVSLKVALFELLRLVAASSWSSSSSPKSL